MFRSFIYLDEDKLYTYKRQIKGDNILVPKSISQKKTAGFSASINGLGLSSAAETNVDGEFQIDVSFDYDRFELELNKLEGEDFFDFVLNDYDLTTVPSMKIIRIYNGVAIPEEFDMVNLVQRFKPMLMEQIETSSAGEQEALNNVLGKASADIPFVCECDDATVSGKLNTKWLYEDYSQLEDYVDQDVYILCKTIGMSRKNRVEIFDPLKDFVRLPRLMRRKMEADGDTMGLNKIAIDGPVLKVEVIAMYK